MSATQLPIRVKLGNHRFTGTMDILSRVEDGPYAGRYNVFFSGHDRLAGPRPQNNQWVLSANDVLYWTGIDLREN